MSSSASAGKTPRILACVLCQHRKIKCDRNTPCSNCIKAGVSCTPSTPAPARKRRRPNHDLQQRLARCEELLQEYATAKPAGTPSETTGNSPPEQLPKPPLGKLVQANSGGVQFMDSYLWANVYDELRGMREIIDEDGKDDDSCSTPADHSTPDQNAALLFSDGAEYTTEDLHPEPAQVLGLWQIFVDRVNPITRVIHVPTVQPLVAAAATDRRNLERNKEALLFAIYAFASIALSEHECRTLLRCSRDDAFNRFSKACRITFMRIGILQRYDLVVLQALVLYQLSLSGRYDRHAAWILNGTIVRIAQKMGLHRDGQMFGLSPFDTEMRRRIWWQIVLLDGIYALMSGLGQAMIPRSWDTKEPSNINDNDMSPGMSKIEPREGPTDMVYCLLCYEVAKLLVESPGLELVILQNEMGLSESPSDVATARKRIDDLDARLTEILDKHCDVTMGPVHELAIEARIEMVNKMRDLICPPRDQPEWQTEIKTPKDNLFKISITTGEHSLRLYRHTEKRGYFLWLGMTHFPVEVYQFMVSQLSTRTSGPLVDRAWRVLEELYHYHEELYKLSIKSSADLAMFVLRAWRAREPVLQQATGMPVEKPYFVGRVESLLGIEESKKGQHEAHAVTPRAMGADMVATGSTGDMRWDQLLGYVDSSTALNWDMFGNPVDMGFGGAGMGIDMGMNGWM